MDDCIICPKCKRRHEPDEIDPGNEAGYVYGEHVCLGCETTFFVETYTQYVTKDGWWK